MGNGKYNSRFFKYIDNPPMVGVFELDEFIVFLVSFIGLMLIALLFDIVLEGGVLVYAIIAVLVTLSYLKYKKNKPKGFFFQKLYRWGVYEPRNWRDFSKVLNLKVNSKKYKSFKVLPYGFIKKMSGS